ncbi:hypothetical protein TCAL_11497 [Tigriopus californicus]|uniref:Phosducin domain-containing protein n=1 Tax=Tigriopus californicus TaxID=6832 RepID=A0A553NEJ5_TIGCA|nr:phosducin-like protein [Tigriopus californicus]TRY63835.1 hypothetical protein TCAL_11497 [Tigriopus californicus]|eukprot:TCALIF_11497-PA protein Name:"Similar to CG7650 Phosducin-like protein (Drosophila melanogaster)" AED:0.20 eAED:0.20 QI:0/-1/0/1/-1/1/1/0/283
MATLDDKLLGEKLHYYCSSSEDEGDEESPSGAGGSSGPSKFIPEGELSQWDGQSANTGPKGVIKDWQRYKQLERENRDEQQAEMMTLAQKLSLTCRTDAEDQKAQAQEEAIDEDLEALLDDEFLQEYMEKRMRQMMDQATARRKVFGCLRDLTDGEDFLNAIDKEEKHVIVVVCIYEKESPGCQAMIGCLEALSKDHPNVKFCKILASSAGLSKHFKVSGVPALLVYQGGDLMTNFVRLTDTLGEDFFVSDVESLLLEHGVLSQEEPVPDIIKNSAANDSDAD